MSKWPNLLKSKIAQVLFLRLLTTISWLQLKEFGVIKIAMKFRFPSCAFHLPGFCFRSTSCKINSSDFFETPGMMFPSRIHLFDCDSKALLLKKNMQAPLDTACPTSSGVEQLNQYESYSVRRTSSRQRHVGLQWHRNNFFCERSVLHHLYISTGGSRGGGGHLGPWPPKGIKWFIWLPKRLIKHKK